MLSERNIIDPYRQKGLALLLFVIILALAFVSYAVSELSIWQIKDNQKKNTLIALKHAKRALIEYAVTHADRLDEQGEIGFLPCPDYDIDIGLEGAQDIGSCDNKPLNAVGLLPWKTLEIPVLRDGDGVCLMYAVSSTYKLNPPSSTDMLNEDSSGMFQIVDENNAVIQGANAADRLVAVVFAPGKPLAGQFRNFAAGTDCGEDADPDGIYVAAAYLEGNGVTNNSDLSDDDNSVDQFIHATSTSENEATPYNDQFVTITREEIWSVIKSRTDYVEGISPDNGKMARVTESLSQCLAAYANNNGKRRLPWPVTANFGVNDYRKNSDYKDHDNTIPSNAGRFPFDVTNSAAEMAVAGGNILFDTGWCSNLVLTIIDPGDIVDLDTPLPAPDFMSEERKIWENWKDHFFYTVSADYEPMNAPATGCTAGGCITVDAIPYAGAVIFSGYRQAGEIRTIPLAAGDADTVFDPANFLVPANAALFPDDNGNGAYVTGDNDIMFCLLDIDTDADMLPDTITVVRC